MEIPENTQQERTTNAVLSSMDRIVAPRRVSERNSSAPVKHRGGGRAFDGSSTSRTRRISRLDSALKDARKNSVICTSRHQFRVTKVGSDNANVNQLENVYDRVHQRNNALAEPPARIPTLSVEQLQAAEQAVQGFVDKMRQTADSTDAQTKSELTQALTSDITASRTKILSESGLSNQVDDVSSWYSMGSEIGRGTFGRVRVATHRLSGTPVAIKSYSCLHAAKSCLAVDKQFIGDSGGDALEWRRVRQEVKILSRLRAHPSVMRFVESFETPTRVHVVTELIQGTSLCEVLQRTSGQRLTEPRARRIFLQLVEAVEALHSQNVIHRDLKLENVLLNEDSGHATIIDFGFSDLEEMEPQTLDCIKRSRKKNFCGTPAYMAPEVIASERYDGKPVDIWSLGVLLYVMLCGKFPFQGASFHQLYQKLRSGVQQLRIPSTLSSDARALLYSVLTFDPAKRPNASELLYCPWLQSLQTSPQLGNMLKLSFEAWPGTHQAIYTALTELYSLPLKGFDLNSDKRSSRHTRLSSFLRLATAESYYHFQRLMKASVLSSENNQMKCTGFETSTRHKEQLAKLIGLVKSSLSVLHVLDD